eukprot:TRINITY_DN601_c0_g1_i1.p1 TRINITY_DN601_c0_g1~~TRINITY_DN601_c0_g1_i1.p1  ORF type:complete len:200 (-),score=43.87 TRINITY_DN601_c0_g1_i1:262-861(-)
MYQPVTHDENPNIHQDIFHDHHFYDLPEVIVNRNPDSIWLESNGAFGFAGHYDDKLRNFLSPMEWELCLSNINSTIIKWRNIVFLRNVVCILGMLFGLGLLIGGFFTNTPGLLYSGMFFFLGFPLIAAATASLIKRKGNADLQNSIDAENGRYNSRGINFVTYVETTGQLTNRRTKRLLEVEVPDSKEENKGPILSEFV